MEPLSQSISPRPKTGAWVASFLSLAAVLFVALVALHGGKIFRYRSLYASLENHLDLKEYSLAQLDVTEMSKPPLLFNLADMLTPEATLDLQLQQLQIARGLLEVLSAVAVSRVDEAERRLLALPAGSVDATVQKMQGYLAELENSARALDEQRRILGESNTALSGLDNAGNLVAHDFGELLGLAPDTDPNDPTPPEPYSGGVLQGLPKLKKLRDTIADLSFLKVELEALGGAVNVEGANSHEAFVSKLEALKRSYSELEAQREELLTRRSHAEEGSLRFGRTLSNMRGVLQGELGREILSRLSPPNPWNFANPS
jgi:hypothetical protein